MLTAMTHSPEPLPTTRLRGWEQHDDADLVERALDGDRWASEALYRRHVRRIAATAIRLLRDRTEAEDITQEAFVEALDGLDQLRDPSAFGAWLLQIAVRKVHRRFRRRKMLRVLGFTHEGDVPLDSVLSGGASPEEAAELRLLERALAKLSAAERTAWMLRHIEGYKLGEVAVACDCSLATVKRRIEAAQVRIDRHTEVSS